MAALASSPLLALFLVVALGAAIGLDRIGPLRFGAAGRRSSFGLAVSACIPGRHPHVNRPADEAANGILRRHFRGSDLLQDLRKRTNLLS